MKSLIHTLIAISALLALSACEAEYQDPKLDSWNNATVATRTVNGKEVPATYIFNCRHITDAKNVHYYYNLIADPQGVENYNEKGEKVTTYQNASFRIQYFSSNHTKSSGSSILKEVINVEVDFQIIESSLGYSEAIVTANESTAETFKYYKNNPYFNHVQIGDELLRLRSNSFQRTSTNMTELDLPGITNGDQLECR